MRIYKLILRLFLVWVSLVLFTGVLVFINSQYFHSISGEFDLQHPIALLSSIFLTSTFILVELIYTKQYLVSVYKLRKFSGHLLFNDIGYTYTRIILLLFMNTGCKVHLYISMGSLTFLPKLKKSFYYQTNIMNGIGLSVWYWLLKMFKFLIEFFNRMDILCVYIVKYVSIW